MSAATAASPQNRPSGGPPSSLADGLSPAETSRMIEQLDGLGVLMGQVRRAAVGGVIFGQDTVVDQTLITVLSGGHAAC